MTSSLVTAPANAPVRDGLALGRVLTAAVLLGLSWGAVTSFLQTVLPSPFAGLANAAAPWLWTPFVVGALARSRRQAAALGLLACTLQVGGYYVTADLRGFPVGVTYVLVWTAAAVVGGPVFGLAGRMWRTATGRLRGLAPALVAGVWAAEAVGTYWLVLGYHGDAAVFGTVAAVLVLGLGLHRQQLRPALLWGLAVVPLGTGAFLVLHEVLGGGGLAGS